MSREWRRERQCRCGCGGTFEATVYNEQYVDKSHELKRRSFLQRERRLGHAPQPEPSDAAVKLEEEMQPVRAKEADVAMRAQVVPRLDSDASLSLWFNLLGVAA